MTINLLSNPIDAHFFCLIVRFTHTHTNANDYYWDIYIEIIIQMKLYVMIISDNNFIVSLRAFMNIFCGVT